MMTMDRVYDLLRIDRKLQTMRLQLRPILYWLSNWSHFREIRDNREHLQFLDLEFQLLSEGKQIKMSVDYCMIFEFLAESFQKV
jgi:hypothetical protein